MRRTLPSLAALQCFEAAARQQSFTQAAQALNLSQSAVSRQIRLLEELVREPLFHRVRQRVKLTAAGQRYLSEIQPLLEGLEAATLNLRSFHDPRGGINIGTYPTIGSRWLLPYLLRFADATPEITTNTITYLDNAGFDPNLIDIGIVQGDPPWPGMRADTLMAEDLAPVVSPDLAPGNPQPDLDPEALLSLRLLQHTTRPQSWSIWFESLGRPYREPSGGLFFSQFEMIIEAAIAGQGIGMLPLVLVRRELADGRLRLAHPHIARAKSAYYLLTPLSKSETPKIQTFRRWLLEQVREESP